MRSRTLFSFKLEGEGFTPGWLPLRAAALLHDLLEAAAEAYGSDPNAADKAVPQVRVTGRGSVLGDVGSTSAGLATPLRNMVKDLARERARPAVQTFVRRHFVENDHLAGERFSFIDVTLPKGNLPTVRLDASKASSLAAVATVTTGTTVYAEVLSVGGVNPTAKLRLRDGTIRTAPMPSRDAALALANRLYTRVKIRARLTYDLETLETIAIAIDSFDDLWREQHFADVVAGGLELQLDPPTLSDLLVERGHHLRVAR